MASKGFDCAAWRLYCQNTQVSCEDRSLSPMHAFFIFSQAIDDALQDVALEHMEQAFDIAHAYGYESSLDRASFVHWFTHQPPLRATC